MKTIFLPALFGLIAFALMLGFFALKRRFIPPEGTRVFHFATAFVLLSFLNGVAIFAKQHGHPLRERILSWDGSVIFRDSQAPLWNRWLYYRDTLPVLHKAGADPVREAVLQDGVAYCFTNTGKVYVMTQIPNETPVIAKQWKWQGSAESFPWYGSVKAPGIHPLNDSPVSPGTSSLPDLPALIGASPSFKTPPEWDAPP